VKNYFIKQIYNSIFIPFVFVVFFWLVFLFDFLYDLNLVKFGVLPREIKGLTGIITSVFIHANLNHAASNTLPILILGMMLFYFYKKIAKSIFFMDLVNKWHMAMDWWKKRSLSSKLSYRSKHINIWTS
jgi:membrane associated rhomboid family serine protease